MAMLNNQMVFMIVALVVPSSAAASPVKLAPALAHKAASSATAGEKSASFQCFGRSWATYPASKDIWSPSQHVFFCNTKLG